MIRLATKRDALAIANLIEQRAVALNEQGSDQWTEYLEQDLLKRVETDIASGDVYVYEQADAILASIALLPPDEWDHALWKDGERGQYIHRIVVSEQLKGQGVGQQLMEHVLEEANGEHPIRLDCVADNAFLNEYYPQFGFVYVGTHNGYNTFEYKLEASVSA
ncbi:MULTISPECIES: GNAT family N-acetyltransferase [Exiguobacterium]|uniref:GNAT family N-acetyltransferase n=1 Tax=Exiguobacterium TaxID=33986 RepID=UPI001BE5EADC|nr:MULTISPECIES: GNAT family N-acetyltransferase [Exiguobacterium]MCT4783263.1 GNAT family N-acetyltransferase [Exiguobacterium himgiriensis]